MIAILLSLINIFFLAYVSAVEDCNVSILNNMKTKNKQDLECNFDFAAPNGQKSQKVTAHLPGRRVNTNLGKWDKYSKVEVKCDLGNVASNEFKKVADASLAEKANSNTKSGVDCKTEKLCVIVTDEANKQSSYYKVAKNKSCLEHANKYKKKQDHKKDQKQDQKNKKDQKKDNNKDKKQDHKKGK